MKLKTVSYLSAFACFSFGFGLCNSCGKKEPDDKPDENKSSNSTSRDYAVDKVAQESSGDNVDADASRDYAVDKVAQEKQWAAMIIDDDKTNLDVRYEKNRVNSAIDTMTDEDNMVEEGTKIKEKMTAKLATLKKLKSLLCNPEVTAKRLKVGLNSLGAEGKMICINNYMQECLLCFEDDEHRQRRIRSTEEETNKMKQVIADWDEGIGNLNARNIGDITRVDFLKMALRKLSDSFDYLRK
jgi:hypothetical protein